MPKRAAVLALPLLLIAAVHGFGLSGGLAHALEGALFGPDSYMRLVRVEALLETDAWHETRILRANWPFGADLHWTRPFDLLLIAAAAPFALVLGWHDGLRWAGTLIGPLLHVGALLAMLWALRPLRAVAPPWLAGLLFAAQFYVAFQFAPARPDHHGLLALTMILGLGLALRLLADPADRRLAVLSGLLIALFLWLAPEGGLYAGLLWSALTIEGLRRWRHDGGAARLQAGLLSAFSALLALTVALLIERPVTSVLPDGFELDRLSATTLAAPLAVAVLLALPLGLRDFRQRTVARKLLLAAAGASLVLVFLSATMLLALAVLNSLAAPLEAAWQTDNSDTRAMLDPRVPGGGWPELVAHLGAPILALICTVHRTVRQGRDVPGPWRFLLLFQLATLLLALWQQRWTGYAQIAALPALTVLVALLLARLDSDRPGRAALRAMIVLTVCFGFLLTGGLLSPGTVAATADCPRPTVARHLAKAYPEPHTILSYIYAGPALLYFSPHRVIATPYHRNLEAIEETANVLGEGRFLKLQSETASVGSASASFPPGRILSPHEGVTERKVDLLLICPGEAESGRYTTSANTLHSRLDRDEIPSWLRRVSLPDGLGDWRLYEVIR